MNLMGDLASWACWTVHLRTPQLDVGVIATRRKYIPPVGDQYCDIFIVQTDDVETRESPVDRRTPRTPFEGSSVLELSNGYHCCAAGPIHAGARAHGRHALAARARTVLR